MNRPTALVVFGVIALGCTVALAFTLAEAAQVLGALWARRSPVAIWGMMPVATAAILLPVMGVSLILAALRPERQRPALTTRGFQLGCVLAVALPLVVFTGVKIGLSRGGYTECPELRARGTFSTRRSYVAPPAQCPTVGANVGDADLSPPAAGR